MDTTRKPDPSVEQARAILQKYNPCPEGYAWLNGFTAEHAWNTCTRYDWMLWAMEKLGVPKETFVLCARKIALSVAHLWDVPPVVKTFLDTGENPAEAAAWAEARAAAWAAEAAAAWAARAAAWAARAATSWAAAAEAAWAARAAAAEAAAAWAAEAAWAAAAEAAWAARAAEAAWAAKRAICGIIREILPWSEMQKYAVTP